MKNIIEYPFKNAYCTAVDRYSNRKPFAVVVMLETTTLVSLIQNVSKNVVGIEKLVTKIRNRHSMTQTSPAQKLKNITEI